MPNSCLYHSIDWTLAQSRRISSHEYRQNEKYTDFLESVRLVYHHSKLIATRIAEKYHVAIFYLVYRGNWNKLEELKKPESVHRIRIGGKSSFMKIRAPKCVSIACGKKGSHVLEEGLTVKDVKSGDKKRMTYELCFTFASYCVICGGSIRKIFSICSVKIPLGYSTARVERRFASRSRQSGKTKLPQWQRNMTVNDRWYLEATFSKFNEFFIDLLNLDALSCIRICQSTISVAIDRSSYSLEIRLGFPFLRFSHFPGVKRYGWIICNS